MVSWPQRRELGITGPPLSIMKQHGRGGGSAPHPSLFTTCGSRELTLHIPSCCTQENGPCTSPGQRSRAETVDGGVWELPGRCELGRPGPIPCLPCGGAPTLTACGRWESWPFPSPTVALGEWPLHLAWATQELALLV